jgi:nicotinamidase-related amidase
MTAEQLLEQARPFLKYVADWKATLPSFPMTELVADQPEKVAVMSVDLINGFCYEGPLASPRIASLVGPITDLFQKSYAAGIRHFVLTQDAHTPDSVEFATYPPHCIRGTSESETIPALQQLPFAELFQMMPKQSIHSALSTELDNWLTAHPQIDTFIVVGDCTDLCTYHLAMHLKLRAVAVNQSVRVLLPANCVDTYDLPVPSDPHSPIIPHDGDLLHHIFLYHMQLNGIEVVECLV